MSGVDPAVTVVIPTRHRAASLSRGLEALQRQDVPAGHVEVVVVDDGDGDPPLARESPSGLTVRVLRNRGRGAAAARNTGAAAATGPLLLFLDDDIEASPGLIRAHLEAVTRGASLSVGYLPAQPAASHGFFAVTLRNWWEAMFAEIRQPGHRFTFRDVLSGNCAITADLFRRVGGFDEALACHEDYELGYRVLRAGARPTFCPEAAGVHHEVTTLERSLERKRAEGRADVAIVRKHPELLVSLPMNGALARWGDRAALWKLPFASPSAAGRAVTSFGRRLAVFEALRMRGRWLRRLDGMLEIAYWQGVAAETGSLEAFHQLVRAAASAAGAAAWWLRVDLRDGVKQAARRVDAFGPDGLVVEYHGEAVGLLPATPGAEPLRGAHLEEALAGRLAWPLLGALGRTGNAPIEERDGRLVASRCLPREPLDLR